MSTYITLANYTHEGITNIKGSPQRAAAARELAKSCGAEMKDFYLTMGPYDLVVVVEAPDDETATRFSLAVSSLGNVRTTTLKAFTETEYKSIVESIP